MVAMTTKTELEQLDDIHEGLTILEGNLRCTITDIKEKQRTLELIILAKGVLQSFPDAVSLKVEIRDGIAVPLQLLGKNMPADGQTDLALPERELISSGRVLDQLHIQGWLLGELLGEISRGSDVSWINQVDELPDVDTDFEDPYRSHKTEFSILLAKAANLPVPSAVAALENLVSEDSRNLETLRAGLLTVDPGAYMLYVRHREGEWEVEELVDETGLVLRAGGPLAAEAIRGGTVGGVLSRIPHTELASLVTGARGTAFEETGAVLGIHVDPGLS